MMARRESPTAGGSNWYCKERMMHVAGTGVARAATATATAPPAMGTVVHGGELGERLQLRRQMRKAVYESAVTRESHRIVEDILLPEILRAADESNHVEECRVLVPHVVIGPMSKELPKSYRRSMYEDDVAEACRMLVREKGLDDFVISLERSCDDAHLPRCSVLDMMLVRCLPSGLPTRPLAAERCLTFTATLPPLNDASPIFAAHVPPSPPVCPSSAWGLGIVQSSAPPVTLSGAPPAAGLPA